MISFSHSPSSVASRRVRGPPTSKLTAERCTSGVGTYRAINSWALYDFLTLRSLGLREQSIK